MQNLIDFDPDKTKMNRYSNIIPCNEKINANILLIIIKCFINYGL